MTNEEPPGTAAAPGIRALAPPEIEWKRFSELFAQVFDRTSEVEGTEGEKDDHGSTTADAVKSQELWLEFTKIADKARSLSDHPFFDPRILPGYLQSVFGNPLRLSETQLAEADDAARTILEDHLSTFDPYKALPIERYREKQRILSEFTARLSGSLDEDQMDRLAVLQKFNERAFGGQRKLNEIDLKPLEAGARGMSPEDRIFHEWESIYHFQEEQKAAAREAAARFSREAGDVLSRYGRIGKEPKDQEALDLDGLRRLDEDLYQLQAKLERSFQGILAPEQIEQASRKPPSIFRFNYGGNISQTAYGDMGF